MKKILLTAVALVFCMAGSASALMFSDTKTLDVDLAEGPIAGLLISDSISYTHATPADFEVPWDIVNSASLTISGYWIDGNDDIVKVEGVAVGTLTPGGTKVWNWSSWSYTYTFADSSFDIASTFSSWSTGADLGVTLTANGSFGDGRLHISTSRFDLDYDNQAAPVPEPSTMLLFGAGALGLFGYSRKRSHKKA